MTDAVVRVALVEDHALLRALLAEHLGRVDGLVLAACVGTAAEARQQITRGTADVAVLDVGLPDGDGIALGVLLQRADPDLRVLLLSAQDALEPMLVTQRACASPWSFLSKRSALAADRLVEAVRWVAAGRVVIDPARGGARGQERDAIDGLNAQQVRVLRLVALGLTNTAVGAALGVSPKAVEAAMSTVYRVLDLAADRNPRVAAVLAYRRHADLREHAGADRADAP
jgi:DNA-binding NarL/FixJ family response regulator